MLSYDEKVFGIFLLLSFISFVIGGFMVNIAIGFITLAIVLFSIAVIIAQSTERR